MGISKKGWQSSQTFWDWAALPYVVSLSLLYNSHAEGWTAPLPQDFKAAEKQSLKVHPSHKSSLHQQIPELTNSAG